MKDDVVIVGAARTPVGSFNGALSSLPAHMLGKVAIEGALSRAGVEGKRVTEVILGQILTAAQGQNPARQASIAAGIPVEVPAWGVNQLCGSGLRAVALGYQAVVNGDADIVVAGKLAHHLDGSVMDRRQTAAELGERLCFNSLDQVPENVVEDVDLLVGQPIRLGDKQISNAPQRIDAFVFRSVASDRLFQLDDKRLPHAHGDGASCMHGGGWATVEEVISTRKG